MSAFVLVIAVAAAAAPPVAVDDVLTTEKNTPGTVNVLDNDTDPDGDTLSVTGATDPPNGSVDCTPDGFCTYTPDADYVGGDSFDYTASDPGGETDTGTVNVTVNEPPAPCSPAVCIDNGTVLLAVQPRGS